MTSDNIETAFRDAVNGEVRLGPEGINRYRVFTPFHFDDGDLVSVVLREEGTSWILSDEGNTFMRLSYRLDDKALEAEGRTRIIQNAIASSGIDDRDGELVATVRDERFGEALYSLVQAILRVADVSVWTREVVRSTFVADVREVIEEFVPANYRQANWHYADLDPDGMYKVDWYIRGAAEPLFVFALTTDDKVKDATIVLHQFEKWAFAHRTLGIFQDQQQVTRKTLAHFMDVGEKSLSTLPGNEDRVREYLRRTLPPDVGLDRYKPERRQTGPDAP